jgi:hypothetical protein
VTASDSHPHHPRAAGTDIRINWATVINRARLAGARGDLANAIMTAHA